MKLKMEFTMNRRQLPASTMRVNIAELGDDRKLTRGMYWVMILTAPTLPLAATRWHSPIACEPVALNVVAREAE
eukprot:COSAG02_NODE_90_length_37755_cov_29.833364_36_plen_74_part_00